MRDRIIYMAITGSLMLASSQMAAQTNKDALRFDKLEREVRKGLDKSLGEFKPARTKQKPMSPDTSATMSDPLVPEYIYDKFKDLTTVTIGTPVYHSISRPEITNVRNLSRYIADVDVFAIYLYSGVRPVKPTSVNVVFKATAGGTLFELNPSFIVIADDKRFRLGDMVRNVESSSGLMKDYVSIPIPYETFAEIANADLVEVQIGNLDFPLSELNLKSFRILAGLPQKPEVRSVEKSALPPTVLDRSRLEHTIWEGEKLSVEFRPDGIVTLVGNLRLLFGTVIGSWVQKGDRVEIRYPDREMKESIGLGIIKDDKMVLKFYKGAIFPLPTTVIQRVP